MIASFAVSELLVRWEESRRSGRAITPEELCRDCPDQVGEVKQLIAALESIDDLATLRVGDNSKVPSPAAGTGPPRYQRVRPHAAGGLGEVWVGHDHELGRPIALKRVHDRLEGSADARQRFVREAEITARLQHPGIVPVYGLFREASGQLVYAMRFIEGRSLLDAIADYHAAPNDPTLRQLLQRFVSVCNTLAYAHRHGVIHRDLKPANVMLGEFGETLVVDWGVARVIAAAVADRADEVASPATIDPGGSATRAGSVLGTPAYMSPEQAVGQSVGSPADVFGLGATLFHVLTNQPPYSATTTAEVLALARAAELPAPRRLRAGIPRPLDAICRKALARLPEERYASALDLAGDVEHWLAGELVTADREPWYERSLRWGRRHRLAVATCVASLLVAAVALAVGAVLLHDQQLVTAAQRDRADENAVLAQRALDENVMAVVDHPRLVHADFFAVRRELLAKAVPFYEQLVRQQADDPRFAWRYGKTYERLALVRSEIGENERAMADLDRAHEVFAGIAANDPSSVAMSSELGRTEGARANILKRLGRTSESEAAYRWAIDKLAQCSESPDSQQAIASVHLNYGVLLREAGRLPEAEAISKRARDDFKTAADARPNDPHLRRELSKAEHNLGYLYSDLGRLDDATAAYDRALIIQQELATAFPTIPNYRHAMAQTCSSQGNLLEARSKSAEAEEKHRTALNSFQQLANEFPTLPEYRRDLATSWNNLGNALDHQHKDVAAEDAFLSAIRLEERLAVEFVDVPAYRQGLARSLSNLAVLYARLGRRSEATTSYRKVIELYEQLAAEHGGVIAFRLDRARTICNLGYLALDDGRPADAISWQSNAITALRAIRTQSPELAAGRVLLRNSFGGRAMAWDASNDPKQALRDWDAALKQCADDDRSEIVVSRARTLVRAGEPGRAVDEIRNLESAKLLMSELLVDAAKVCAAAAAADMARADEFAGRALQLLRKAVDSHQVKNRAALETLVQLSDFAPLRDRADLRALLDGIQPR